MKTPLFLYFLLGVICFAGEPDVSKLDPGQIVKKSSEAMSRMTFRGETLRGGIKTVIYHRTNPDGTVDQRTENSMSKPLRGMIDKDWKLVMLKNSEGLWELRSGVAVRLDYLSDFHKSLDAAIDNPIRDEELDNYTISEDTQDGIPCYFIKAAVSAAGKLRLMEIMKGNETFTKLYPTTEQLANAIPVEIKYRIGKMDFFMYSRLVFNKNSEMILGYEYTNVVKNLALSDDLFEVPKDLKIQILKTEQEAAAFRGVGLNLPNFSKVNKVGSASSTAKIFVKTFLVFTLLMIVPIFFFLKKRQ